MESPATTTTIPEAVFVEIIVRLPLRSIARFKSVSKRWKALIESSYLRRVFVSLHKQSSSSSWSLMFGTDYPYPIAEAIGLHGCKTWDLPRSLGSYITPFQPHPDPRARVYYISSSNGLIWIDVFVHRTDVETFPYKTFVGNPVLQQWVEIPPPPQECKHTALVTRLDEDGVVSSFKVVRTCDPDESVAPNEWRVYVYSSETGLWSFKRLMSSVPVQYTCYYPPVNVDGVIYRWERIVDNSEPGSLLAYDFFGPEDGDDCCQVIPLPLPYNEDVRRCLTASGGDVVYIEVLDGILKVWTLNKNKNGSGGSSSEWWHLSGEEINLVSAVGYDLDCFPMALNPFNADIVYVWSCQDSCLVSGNLKTQEFIVHQGSESRWSSGEGCYCAKSYLSSGYIEDNHNITSVLMLSQFVLPQWMDPVPRLPN